MSINYEISIPPDIVWNLPGPAVSSQSSTSSSSSLHRSENYIFNFFKEFFLNIYYHFDAKFSPILNPQLSHQELSKKYFSLGQYKALEAIDGYHHHYGMQVYDLGLHGGSKEKGYLQGIEKAHRFIGKYLNRKIDANWYLKLHRVACGHFRGSENDTLMGPEEVGIFRGPERGSMWVNPPVRYYFTSQAIQDFRALDLELKREFGDQAGLGELEILQDGQSNVYYKKMPRELIAQTFNKFVNEFYQEANQAQTDDQRLAAIAKLRQRLEWLHPPRDGSGRTCCLVMNKLLVEYGFHPALLEYPYFSNSHHLSLWTEDLKLGLRNWEKAEEMVQNGTA